MQYARLSYLVTSTQSEEENDEKEENKKVEIIRVRVPWRLRLVANFE